MDKLIDMVVERTGISRQQAEQAVDTVTGYLKNNPDQLKGLLGDDVLGQAQGRLGKLFGR